MKIGKGQQYNVTFPQTLRLTHAVLDLGSLGGQRVYFDSYIEVHAVIDGVDHVLANLGGYGGASEGASPEMQVKLDLKFPPGKVVTFYARPYIIPYLFNVLIGGTRLSDSPVAVQINRYFDN